VNDDLHGQKCLSRDTTHNVTPSLVPEDTAVQGKYANIDYDSLGVDSSGNPVRIAFVVKDPENEIILTHEAQRKGVIAWTSAKEGEHTICLTVENASRQKRKFRFGLTFKHADQAVDYNEMAKQEHLSAIIVEIRKLADRVLARKQEQDYQKHLEEKFRDATESMNSRVVWWFVIQLVVVLGSSAYQIWRLRTFFRSKKLQ